MFQKSFSKYLLLSFALYASSSCFYAFAVSDPKCDWRPTEPIQNVCKISTKITIGSASDAQGRTVCTASCRVDVTGNASPGGKTCAFAVQNNKNKKFRCETKLQNCEDLFKPTFKTFQRKVKDCTLVFDTRDTGDADIARNCEVFADKGTFDHPTRLFPVAACLTVVNRKSETDLKSLETPAY